MYVFTAVTNTPLRFKTKCVACFSSKEEGNHKVQWEASFFLGSQAEDVM